LKLLQESIGKMLEDVGIGNNLLNRNLVVPQVRAKTKKKKKWICIKIKIFCTTKEVTRQKKTAYRMEENLC
jgi:hypothetical protein